MKLRQVTVFDPPDSAKALALRLLTDYGSSAEEATRSKHGYANEVWLGAGYVVHIKRGINGGLARAAAVARILPPEAGHPQVLDLGVTGGMEWMVSTRLPGENLEGVWASLNGPARINAVTDLWARLEAVHRTDLAAARALGCPATPFYALNERDARQLLDWLLLSAAIESTVHRQLEGILDRMFEALPEIAIALSHTDPGLHNTVWDGRNAVPIDFETASMAPADLDVECLLRTIALQAGPDPATALLETADLLARPGAAARLWGYAVLRDMWGLRRWISRARDGDLHEPGADPHDLRTWMPLLNLQAHAVRTSWLADLPS